MSKTVIIFSLLFVSTGLYAASFQGLGDLTGGPVYSDAWSTSADGGVIVGASGSANGQEAFRWTEEEGMVPLGDLPGGQFQSIATAVSSNGSLITGFGSITHYKAFQYTSGNGMTELPSSVTINNQTYNYYTIAKGISADGSVLIGKANYLNASLDGPVQGDKACYWADNQMYLLTPPGYNSFSGAQAQAISADASTILIGTNYNTGYLWSESSGFLELPSMDVTKGPFYLMSGDAAVLGGHNRDTRTSFLWSEQAGFTQIELPNGYFDNHIGALNSNGSVVGGQLIKEFAASYDPQNYEAYLWDTTNGIQSVKDILTTQGINLDGWILTGVSGISNDGFTICGNGINPDGYSEAWIATIPEPATLLLTLSGALIALRRRSIR